MFVDRVFVNGRGRDVIMEDMRRRIERGDGEAERREGVDVCFSSFSSSLIYLGLMLSYVCLGDVRYCVR